MIKILFILSTIFFYSGIRLLGVKLFDFLTLVLALALIFNPNINNRRKRKTYSLAEKFLIFFLLVIIITMSVRGTGLKILGSTDWGGGTYLLLISLIIVSLNTKKIKITNSLFKKIVFIMFAFSIIPFIVELLYFYGISGYWNNIISVPLAAKSSNFNNVVSQYARLQTGKNFSIAILVISIIKYFTNKNTKYLILGISVSFILAGLSGHRIALIIMILILLFAFWENTGKNKIQIALISLYLSLLAILAIYQYASYLPPQFQRMISFLPKIHISYFEYNDAIGSTEWRLIIWDMALKSLSQYFWLGKGVAFSQYAFYSSLNSKNSIESAFIVGNFHNGPISLLLPFGIFGFLFASLYIILSLKEIDLKLKINKLLLSFSDFILLRVLYVYALVYSIIFYIIYGDLRKIIPLIFWTIILIKVGLNNVRIINKN